MGGLRLALVIALVAGCRVSGTFVCDTDEDCRSRGSVGRCQIESGFCLFNDDTCTSGFRYADSAGNGLASVCWSDSPPVGDGGVDAVDASTFDPSTCPATYTGTLNGFPNARYVQLAAGQGQAFLQQIVRCEHPTGAPAITHAIVVDGSAKAAALVAFMGSTPRVWVGLVQNPTASSPDTGWIGFTGDPLPAGLWEANEPDDSDGVEDQAESAGVFGPTGLADLSGASIYPVVCECDGRATSPLAAQYITGMN